MVIKLFYEIKQLQLITTFSILLFYSSCSYRSLKEEKAEPPNIIVIMVDDMGYSDIGSYGGEISTPNLDDLAANGLRFTNFYNAARCCPTRASLLTGLYPHEAGMGGMVSSLESEPEPGPYQGFLNENCVTIAEVLSDAGYKTYMSGKWHVGEKKEHWPLQRGFDRYFGLISGASSYFEILKEQPMTRQMALDNQLWEPPQEGFYMTDAITDQAIHFLNEHQQNQDGKPFFLYVAYTAPHWPLHALEEDIQKYKGKYSKGWDALREQRFKMMKNMGIIHDSYQLTPRTASIPAWEAVENKTEWERKMEVYAAMVDRMDQGIGKVINSLKINKSYENTLILFLSDNGGSAENIAGRKLNNPEVPIGFRGSYVAYEEPWANASNTPFLKYKQWTHEGGIATPLIAHWPEVIKEKGAITSQAGHVVDIMATCLDIGKVNYPEAYKDNKIKPVRGESLLPVFEGNDLDKERTIYWEHLGNKALRKGNWKVVSAKPDNDWALYDLSQDPTELKNVSSQYPEIMLELVMLYENWAKEVGVKPEDAD
ncbi:arylsulfatase [soil metagenome]